MLIDVIMLLLLLVFALYGVKRGGAKMILSMASFVLSLIAGLLLYRPISEILKNTGMAQGLSAKLAERMDITGQLPEIMRSYALSAEQELFTSIAEAALSVICFIAVLLLVRIILGIVSTFLGIASSLPVLRQANELLGGVLGLLLGVMAVLILLGIFALIEAFGSDGTVEPLLEGSIVTRAIYDNNPLLGLLVR